MTSNKPLSERLRDAGAPGELRQFEGLADGIVRWILPDGEMLTPGEAAQRFLPPCGTCGEVWPFCSCHIYAK